jgi:hypothetical protein
MAQSALTVTPPSPTPPTNLSSTGATPPNVPNYTKNTYADWLDNTKFDTYPPPFFDDGTAGSLVAFATNTSALASGAGATAGGTENTYPGAGTGLLGYGAVPASTSVAHEGAGTEVVATTTYTTGTSGNGGGSVGISSAPPLQTVSVGPALTAAAIAAGPNASHASSMSPTTNPALTSVGVASAVSGTGTTLLTCTGTNFVQGCRIWVNNVEQSTTWVSATSMTATINKKREAGTWPVDVKLGGVAVPSTRTLTWT